MEEKKQKYITDSLGEFKKYMKIKIKEKKLKKRDVFYLADIPINYGYKILTGEKRTKQRDIIIRMCYVANFTVAELNEALRLYEMPILYKKFMRDKIIIDGFNIKNIKNEQKNIDKFNEYLLKNDIEPLKSCGGDG